MIDGTHERDTDGVRALNLGTSYMHITPCVNKALSMMPCLPSTHSKTSALETNLKPAEKFYSLCRHPTAKLDPVRHHSSHVLHGHSFALVDPDDVQPPVLSTHLASWTLLLAQFVDYSVERGQW